MADILQLLEIKLDLYLVNKHQVPQSATPLMLTQCYIDTFKSPEGYIHSVKLNVQHFTQF